MDKHRVWGRARSCCFPGFHLLHSPVYLLICDWFIIPFCWRVLFNRCWIWWGCSHGEECLVEEFPFFFIGASFSRDRLCDRVFHLQCGHSAPPSICSWSRY